MQNIKVGDTVSTVRDMRFGPICIRKHWPLRVFKIVSDEMLEVQTIPSDGMVFGLEFKDVVSISQKPPLGLTPKKIWVEERIKAILGAIARYNEASKAIPTEWLRELSDHIADETEPVNLHWTKRFIVSMTYAQASFFAAKQGWNLGEWDYVSSPQTLMGLRNRLVYFVGGSQERADFSQIRDICRRNNLISVDCY